MCVYITQAQAAVQRDRAELAEIRRQMETELQQQADELQQQAVAGVSAQTAELERLRAALEVSLYTATVYIHTTCYTASVNIPTSI
jgi:uncharacterized protein YbjQ (UPF0145 family)